MTKLSDSVEPVRRWTRPETLSDGRTGLTYGVRLMVLEQLLVKEQILVGQYWELMFWEDGRLAWDAADYGGIQSVRLPNSAVWVPDVTLYNRVGSRVTREEDVVVKQNGMVLWSTGVVYHSPCSMDITHFPWDRHSCTLKVGDVGNSDWALVAQQTREIAEEYHLIPGTSWKFTTLEYQLDFQRRSGFFSYVVGFSGIFLTSITLTLFCLPPDFPDKISIALSLFLSYSMLLTIVADSIPVGLTVPLIGKYLFLCIGQIVGTIFCCTMLYNISIKSHPRPNKSVMLFMAKLGRLLLVGDCGDNDQSNDTDSSGAQVTSDAPGTTDTHDSVDVCGTMPDSRGPGYTSWPAQVLKLPTNRQWNLVARVTQRLILGLFVIINVVSITIIYSEIFLSDT